MLLYKWPREAHNPEGQEGKQGRGRAEEGHDTSIHAPNRAIDMHPKAAYMHPKVSIDLRPTTAYFAPNRSAYMHPTGAYMHTKVAACMHPQISFSKLRISVQDLSKSVSAMFRSLGNPSI